MLYFKVNFRNKSLSEVQKKVNNQNLLIEKEDKEQDFERAKIIHIITPIIYNYWKFSRS